MLLILFSEIFIRLARNFLLIGIGAATRSPTLQNNALQAAVFLNIAQCHVFDGLLGLGSNCDGGETPIYSCIGWLFTGW